VLIWTFAPQESPEQLHEIKAAGAIEALEALRARTHNESVQIAALEALVALQVSLCCMQWLYLTWACAVQTLHCQGACAITSCCEFSHVLLAGEVGCADSGGADAVGWVRAQAQGPQGMVSSDAYAQCTS
jgi:hypothetical protein